uniref:DUF4939 domain-containing protein n=1 Tax=Neogobius melanostomus TaxID=47308 RepID=A0A8C6V6S5_9GOBI
MNSADSDPLSHTLAAQSSLLEQHDHTLTALMEHMKEFSVSIASLRTQMTALVPQAAAATGHTPPAPPPAQAPVLPPSTREAYVPPPAPYSGDLGTCKSFLTQCSLIFEQQPYTYANDRAKICYLIGCLRGPALSWASAVWEKQTLSCSSYLAFTTEMKQIFDHPLHNPHFDWFANRIKSWSTFCHSNCLQAALPPVSSESTSVPEVPDLSTVP